MFKIQKAFKRVFAGFFAVLLTFCSLSVGSIEAEAHDAYFLGVAFDTDSCRYIGSVTFQSNSLIGDNHAESDITCDFHKLYTEGTGVPSPNLSADDMEAEYSDYKKDSSFDNDKELLFTFPGFHTKGIATHKLNANGSDELLAERINNSVLGGLNSAIDFIVEQTGESRTDARKIRNLATELVQHVKTNKTGNSSGSGSFGWGEYTIGFSYGQSSLPSSATIEEKDIPKGFTPEDYCEITVNGKSACFIFQAWKGYNYPAYSVDNHKVDENVDPYARDITGNDWYEDVGVNGVYKLGWDALVLQAHYNKDVMGVEFSNLGEILPSSALISAIASLCDFIITGIRSFLGLYALDELMLNRGNRGLSYSMGLFPNGWVGPIYLMFTICLMLTWAVMGFAVIKIFMKRSLATINVGEKMNIMNELKNLAVCCFMLGAFPLIFNMLARINYSLVALFGASTEFTNVIKSFYTLSQANFGSIIACFMGLALQIYFNFFYILRAITVAILYGIAPLAIYTIVLGGKNAKVFGAWSKELLSNIFVQTIHALMIAFFTSVSAVSGLKTFESIVVLYSFIPLTKFVKQNVFQASDGIGGLASNLSDMASSGAKGAMESVGGGGGRSGGSAGGSSGAGGSAGGSGGGGGASTGILADRMAQSREPGRKAVTNSFSDNANANVTSGIGQKAANWVDKDHSTPVGKAVAGGANLIRNTRDSAQGYHANGLGNVRSLNADDSSFQDTGEKQRSLGSVNNRGRVATSGTASVAKGMLKAGGNLALAGAQMGMALGASSYGGQGAERMMREAGGRATGSFNSLKQGVGDAIGDRKVRQHMKNHGIQSMQEDSKYLTKVMDVSYKDHKLQGTGLEKMTDAEKNTLQNICRAHDSSYTDMSKQEKAFYQTQASKMGMHIGIASGGNAKDGLQEGQVVLKYDKAIMNQNRATDPVTYGSAMSEYHEAPKSAVQELAEKKAEGEMYDMSHTNFEGKGYENHGGVWTPSGSSPTPEPKSSPTSNPISQPNPLNNEGERPHPVIIGPDGKPMGGTNPTRNPRPIEDEELKPRPNPQPKPEESKPQESPQVRQARMEEEDYIRNSEPSNQELQDLIMNVNNPGMYGNPNPNEFSKGTNPRGKK